MKLFKSIDFGITAIMLLLLISGNLAYPNPSSNLTIHFSGMGPHLNQNLYLQVVDKATMKETGRIMHQITIADFDIVLNAVTARKSYFIDFFSDYTSNGLYDAPPADHAWRLELDNALGNDELNFVHNTNFTDIDWDYILTVNFSGMTPHIGQMLELRVENNNDNTEVARIKVISIPSADFELQIVGLKLNTKYKAEFYADLNGNGIYDAPPLDHAWRLTFNSSTGDVIKDFAHNTNFTDIQWPNASSVNQIKSAGLVSYQLYQNYPNPFNPATKIKFNLGSKEFVTLKVFNILGNEIATLINSDMDAGSFEVEFDASEIPSGVYFYTLSTESFSSTRKMLLTK